MPTAAQQTDPRREHLRQQAILRRKAVLDRIVGTRALLVGGAVAGSCLLAGYIDASAHTTTPTSGSAGTGTGNAAYGNYGGGSSNYNGGSSNYGSSNYGGSSSSQNLFGGGSPPSASSGGGSAVSGGS